MSEIQIKEGVIEEQLLIHGSYASNTMGSSMRPLLRQHKDVVIILPPEGELKPYDVALYRRGGKYVLHRVLSVKDDHYIIRGDNTFALERVPKECVIGVMTEYNRGGKHHSVTEVGYRIYARFWHFIYPIRYVWHALYQLLRRAYHKIFKRGSAEK